MFLRSLHGIHKFCCRFTATLLLVVLRSSAGRPLFFSRVAVQSNQLVVIFRTAYTFKMVAKIAKTAKAPKITKSVKSAKAPKAAKPIGKYMSQSQVLDALSETSGTSHIFYMFRVLSRTPMIP